uniref:NADH-ubiquinone oxidoreductase chain 2 n=1 Tax=Amazonina sp. Z256E TaxID=2093491 RepID=A0A2P1H9X5_9NEOP|nr:NADH dehydrogenase subunit 2 [Amazonina sp. Z256E]
MLFMMTLFSGVMITISSNSWLGAWMGLEINLLSFIPIMSNDENIYNSESSLKYFIIQALASSVLLFFLLLKMMIESMFTFSSFINENMINFLVSPLLLKSGSAPFHWWFPSVMEGMDWINCFILMSIQKIAPLILISYLIKLNTFLTIIILLSTVVGAIGGLNQTSIRKILTYSSINHIGWMLSGMLMSETIWFFYFILYTLMIISIIFITKPFQLSFINQMLTFNNDIPLMKFVTILVLLSLGGLPPFLGFFPKWMIITLMTLNHLIPLLTVMVLCSLLTLYYYLRISYSSLIINTLEPNWNLISIKSKLLTLFMFPLLSILGLSMMSLLIFFM